MITIPELEKLATLARIKLEESEKEPFIKEFGSILKYIDQLKKIDVSTDAEARIGTIKNVMREDIPKTISEQDRQAIINSAPTREGDFISVKKIIS